MVRRSGKRKYQSKIMIYPSTVVNSFAVRDADDVVAALRKQLLQLARSQERKVQKTGICRHQQSWAYCSDCGYIPMERKLK